jgi:hypothetical protein
MNGKNILPIIKILDFFVVKESSQVLGRWGYHWEKNVRYEKHYDNCLISIMKENNTKEDNWFDKLTIQEQIALCS